MDYSFRIRFKKSPVYMFDIEDKELLLPTNNLISSVTLRARGEERICKSDQLVVVGSGYVSQEEAEDAGRRVQKALTVALTKCCIGADFGDNRHNFTKHGLKWAENLFDYPRALNDVHGLMVFKSHPAPRFVSADCRFSIRQPIDSFLSAYKKSLVTSYVFSPQEELSYSLFHDSLFQSAISSKFLLCVMAVEALIDPQERPKDSLDHVNSLIQYTKESGLSEQEKNSLLGSLKWLCFESIGQAGRRIVKSRLKGEKYMGKTAADFFTHCYHIRSKLVHGHLPSPTGEIDKLSETLKTFVADLLTAPILGMETLDECSHGRRDQALDGMS